MESRTSVLSPTSMSCKSESKILGNQLINTKEELKKEDESYQ